MKTRDILILYQGLRTLIENNKKTFPGKIGYAINRNFRKVTPIVEDYERARMALVIERGKPDPEHEGTYIIEKEEDRRYLDEQIETLLNIENDDIKLSMIKYKDIEDLPFSAAEIDILYPMIDDSEED